jgi:hypothetical protein
MQVIVNIPDEFASDLIQPGSDAGRAALEAWVANEYRERRLTTEQVRRLLGMEYWLDVEAFLLERQIFDYTIEDLDADLAVLEQMRGCS